MQLTTKYNTGDFVWVINGKTGLAIEREIMGVRSQFVAGRQKNGYSFLKDKFNPNGDYHDFLQYEPITEQDKYFWLHESVCYASKEELKNNL